MSFSILKPFFLLFLLFIPAIWIFLLTRARNAIGRKGKIVAGTIKTILILLVGLALSDIRLKETVDWMNLVFCLDVSHSTQSADDNKIKDFLKNTLNQMDEKDSAGLIVFGKEPYVEWGLSKKAALREIRANPDRNHSNLEMAIQSAVGKFPDNSINKIILLSDGNQNMGDALNAATLARSMGVEIWPVPLDSWFGQNEVYIEKLESPPKIPLGTPFVVRTIITATGNSSGELIVFRNNRIVFKQDIDLVEGKNLFTFNDVLPAPGIFVYKAVINILGDTVFENNEFISFTQGSRKPLILYVSEKKDKDTPFSSALKVQGFNIDMKDPESFPKTFNTLLNYQAVILENIPATQLSISDMENIETFVKDAGGGLIMIGGDKSFGAGYFLNTPVEKALPVFMERPTTLEMPDFCLVLLIDKSSSMSGYIKNNTKLEGAKIAAFSVVEMLKPFDRVGICAFDMEYQWVIPVLPADNRETIAEELSKLTAVGGTDLYPALVQVFKTLKATDAKKKHVIILSDGKTNEADFSTLVDSMVKENISISTVAVGLGSDRNLMKNIARWGKGRTYYTDDADKIPRIFTGDTKIAAQNTIIEEKIPTILTLKTEMISGIPSHVLPSSEGMVVTAPKPNAQIIFNTIKGPLLSSWQYGLGRSVAFTGDFSGKWGKLWVEWAHFEKMASQMVRWAQKSDSIATYKSSISRKEDLGHFSVDVQDINGKFINHAELKLGILFPSKRKKVISLIQTAPGRYKADFEAYEIGAYYLTLHGSQENNALPTKTFCFGIPYSDEYKSKGVNEPLLQKLAAMTGGKELQLNRTPSQLFNRKSRAMGHGKSMWPYFTLLFVLIFILDVAFRKILEMRESKANIHNIGSS